jgi:hypothetical protein
MDAFTYWAELQRGSRYRASRLDPEAEEARWRGLARDYNRNALHTSAPAFVRYLAEQVRPGETVFEIGPGTGGFTIPVAARAERVLALDLSPAMLALLRLDLERRRIANVETRRGEWPEVEAPAHDVVLAVNSLYRVLDIRRCIERMTAAARRRVVVAWSVGHNPPVLPSIVDPNGPRRYRPGVTYIHLLLALHELGIPAEVELHSVPRLVWRTSHDEAVQRLIGLPDPSAAECAEAEELARMMFAPAGDGLVHAYEGQVAVIGWPGTARA